MKVSVVIPIYNASEYMDNCMVSVMNQSFTDYEVILVNDGSGDDSYEKAQEWAHKYPNRIRVYSQENSGQGDARNDGVAYAKGEFIMFVDSDDTVDKEFIESAYMSITERDADMAIFDAEIVDCNGRHIENMTGCHSLEKSISLAAYPKLLFEYPAPWNKIYKRDFLISNALQYPTHMWYEDLVGASKFYAKAKKISVCHERLYYYTQRPSSVMHSVQTAKNLEILKALDMIMDYYKFEGLYDKYKNELEYLAIYHILVATAGRIVRADAKSQYTPILVEYMDKKFPNWSKNMYLSELSKANRVKLMLLGKGKYGLLHFLYKGRKSNGF